MLHPVIAKDGHTYERDAIQQWFDNGNVRSPLHSTILLSTELIVNQAMKTFIQEWIEENTSLQGLQKQLQDFHGPLVTATTSKEVHPPIEISIISIGLIPLFLPPSSLGPSKVTE